MVLLDKVLVVHFHLYDIRMVIAQSRPFSLTSSQHAFKLVPCVCGKLVGLLCVLVAKFVLAEVDVGIGKIQQSLSDG